MDWYFFIIYLQSYTLCTTNFGRRKMHNWNPLTTTIILLESTPIDLRLLVIEAADAMYIYVNISVSSLFFSFFIFCFLFNYYA